MRSLTLVAVTHQRTPFTLLEQVTLDADTTDAVALALKELPGVSEAVVLATCNRTELYVLASVGPVVPAALQTLADHTGVPAAQLGDVALVLHDDDASMHLFRVAAGLESRVIGEGEILGQVRRAAARAQGHDVAGPDLAALFRWAAAAGRRARRGATGPAAPSLARTALDAAGTLAPGDETLVVGAGAMAAALTTELRARGLPYRVAARRPDAAARLARRPGDVVPFDRLDEHIGAAALIVCTTSARHPVLHRKTVDTARADTTEPVTIVDLSMPRNVEPMVAGLDGVTLLHLDQLSGGGGDLHARRASEAVHDEHERYLTWLGGRAAGPVIAAFREQVSAICLAEARSHLPAEDAARLAHRVAGRVLHAPTLALKDLSARGETTALEAIARALGIDMESTAVHGDAVAAVS